MTEDGKGGLNVDRDPRREESLEGGPGPQEQEWPGSDEKMRPKADHGEETYRGSNKLQGRRALITGGDSGIGRAVAIAFAREGADVCIAYYDEHEDADQTMRWVEKADRRGAAFAGDLTDREQCREVVERTVEEIGGLDLLVNNIAVHFETEDFREISDDQLDRIFKTNVISFFRVTRTALKHMPDGSAIINTGSVTGLEGHPTLIDYAASKGAVHVFTKSLATTLSERGIRVNCVAPGPVWTPLIPATRKEQEVEGFGADTYWNRPAHPAEVAPAFVYLASDDSRFVTGEVLGITGYGQTTR